MTKRYIEDSEQVFSTGVYLHWDAEKKEWVVDWIEDDTYCDGDLVNTDEHGLPYVEN